MFLSLSGSDEVAPEEEEEPLLVVSPGATGASPTSPATAIIASSDSGRPKIRRFC